MPPGDTASRVLGIDLGAETIKVVELTLGTQGWQTGRRRCVDHDKDPGPRLLAVLEELDWPRVRAAVVTGRLSRLVRLPRVPAKQAQARAYRFLCDAAPATVVSVGSHGFSVLELRSSGAAVYRENSRCSQGTGNFLRQLTERFGLTVAEASTLCASVSDPAPLSGRCPVILKTDMTHLANKGEDRARILAGLFDAVCVNVLTLVKPRVSPSPVVLIGGVSRSERVRANVARFLAANGMSGRELSEEDALFFEALGGALVATERTMTLPALAQVLAPQESVPLERLPPLTESLARVRRLPAPPPPAIGPDPRTIILGFDIGSTGSKLVALDAASTEILWEGYRRTGGDPVGAAQALMQAFVNGPAGPHPVASIGVTGSGREIVGSLCMTCYGREVVYVMNEIVAHAEGARHYDPRVDTIFEIGGQDAKYIRLEDGRVIDCAMNEACSAGTGSFIEEQGRKFAGVPDVAALGREGVAAPYGVSLGQHCSVFMAEVIDEAVAGGVDPSAIIAGLYDSVIQNYLNRVKGSRTVGQVIFCQGMPFAADALAAAVVRQTGSEVIVPPNPGTVGALGIALLTRRAIAAASHAPLSPSRFLAARIERKETFVCRSTTGCGGNGNRCRIDSLKTVVDHQRQTFLWGGACSLYDKGARTRKLPDRAPDPFREREALIQRILEDCAPRSGRPRVALTDEFVLKGLFPFFATYLHRLGMDLVFVGHGDPAALRLGIQEANVPFCAPMQLFHGVARQLVDTQADWVFLPMLRSMARVGGEPLAKTCPSSQASPDMLRWTLDLGSRPRLLSPVIDIGVGNLESKAFQDGCRQLAADLGLAGTRWRRAWTEALAAQREFESRCDQIGRAALEFCQAQGLIAVVVLGRPYTIYNKVLNSNVPALLREQGAMAVPLDCYPIAANVPVFDDMYWGYGQRILRAAHQVRRTPGVYGIYASNYSCGPDSFNLHFCGHIMEGKPFAVIETDGHSGDAGTKTRVEAFLHCVREDAARPRTGEGPAFQSLAASRTGWRAVRERGERLLIPRMGNAAEAVAACFRGLGVLAETLPSPDRDTLRAGRRHTSGKECLPMCVTLGSLLQRVAHSNDPDERFAFLMPRALGPCRFGVYNLLHQIVVERLGLGRRVRIWSPAESGYFDSLPMGFSLLLFSGLVGSDVLDEALLEVRPTEHQPGAANEIHARYHRELCSLLQRRVSGDLSPSVSLWEVFGGQLFGVRDILDRAIRELAGTRQHRPLPTVMLVGEIYVRLEPFTNGFVIDELEARGLRVRQAPANEWMEYVAHGNARNAQGLGIPPRLTLGLEHQIQDAAYRVLERVLGVPPRVAVADSLQAVESYLRPALSGEAVLTLGGPLHAWRRGYIDAVVSTGPLECMPNKIAEAQFHHMLEHEGLLSLTLSLNGEPVTADLLDNFAFEVHERFRRRHATPPTTPAAKPPALLPHHASAAPPLK